MPRKDSDLEWKELNDETRHAFWYGSRWIVAVILLILVIGAGLWELGVFSSDVKGRGDAVRTKNSGTNRIAAQERFETMYADVLASDQKLDVLAVAYKADPADIVAATNYRGAVTYCITIRNEYNAEARKYTAEQFRASDLPEKLDATDPKTDCKEAGKETP